MALDTMSVAERKTMKLSSSHDTDPLALALIVRSRYINAMKVVDALHPCCYLFSSSLYFLVYSTGQVPRRFYDPF